MTVRKGSIVSIKGKFFIVNLVLAREGGKEYGTPYGTYIKKEEARKICLAMNRMPACASCPRRKDCAIGFG